MDDRSVIYTCSRGHYESSVTPKSLSPFRRETLEDTTAGSVFPQPLLCHRYCQSSPPCVSSSQEPHRRLFPSPLAARHYQNCHHPRGVHYLRMMAMDNMWQPIWQHTVSNRSSSRLALAGLLALFSLFLFIALLNFEEENRTQEEYKTILQYNFVEPIHDFASFHLDL